MTCFKEVSQELTEKRVDVVVLVLTKLIGALILSELTPHKAPGLSLNIV